MKIKQTPSESVPAVLWRIGEVAKQTGVTTRTLRYWEELELLRPSTHRESGERLYAPSDVARVTRIRNLQELLGFSLAEVRAVLDTEDIDVLDRVRSELTADHVSTPRRRALLEEGIVANDQLLARLDETLSRIQAFRDERAAAGVRLRSSLEQLGDEARPSRKVASARGR
jgi:DNA-binding transcriptional MerR regulator